MHNSRLQCSRESAGCAAHKQFEEIQYGIPFPHGGEMGHLDVRNAALSTSIPKESPIPQNEHVRFDLQAAGARSQLDNLFDSKILLSKDTLYLLVTYRYTVYHLSYVFTSLLGLLLLPDAPYFFAFQLLSIVVRNDILKYVIRSVTTNYKSLLLTALLAFVVIYIYSIIGFLFYRNNLIVEEQNICENMLVCFVQFVNYGLRNGGGIGDIMSSPDWNENNSLFRIIYDSTFFFVVIIILMNIIFGVIIDTFGELRADADRIEEDIKNHCFICGMDRREFDRLSKFGFEYHQNVEHNLWDYLAFYMHLKKKEKTEYTGPEQFVMDMIQTHNYKFVPHLVALSITQTSNEEEETNNMSTIYSKVMEFTQASNSLDENMQKVTGRLEALENIINRKVSPEDSLSIFRRTSDTEILQNKTDEKISKLFTGISKIKVSLGEK